MRSSANDHPRPYADAVGGAVRAIGRRHLSESQERAAAAHVHRAAAAGRELQFRGLLNLSGTARWSDLRVFRADGGGRGVGYWTCDPGGAVPRAAQYQRRGAQPAAGLSLLSPIARI